jgi:Ser/Thr protein kinase RdoA (MazF antagonist)
VRLKGSERIPVQFELFLHIKIVKIGYVKGRLHRLCEDAPYSSDDLDFVKSIKNGHYAGFRAFQKSAQYLSPIQIGQGLLKPNASCFYLIGNRMKALVMLTHELAGRLLQRLGIRDAYSLHEVKQHNHVYRIETAKDTFFLKTYTKSWYAHDLAGTAYCVDHEVAAWKTLASNGLSTPDVVLAEASCNNVLHRPFLLTRRLTGKPLTEQLRGAGRDSFRQLLYSVGRYLFAMHRIRFAYPGYVTSLGLNAPPDLESWQHPIWTIEQFEREAQQTWREDRQLLPTRLVEEAESYFKTHLASLISAYAIPHFTHGDCHASQFFLTFADQQWQVTGVVDMEVASAGDCGADLVKFGLEMAALFSVNSQWWEPFFEGYGDEPSFELLKLRMLAIPHTGYTYAWPGTRQQIFSHVLKARDWQSLYNLDALS